MRQQQPEDVLSNQLRELAPKHHIATAQMGLDLVAGGSDSPSFRIEPPRVERWSLGRVEDIGYEPIALANAVHPIVDQSHQHAVAILPPLLLRRIELGQVRAI